MNECNKCLWAMEIDNTREKNEFAISLIQI